MNLLIERLIKTGGTIENFLKNIFGEYGWDKKFKNRSRTAQHIERVDKAGNSLEKTIE